MLASQAVGRAVFRLQHPRPQVAAERMGEENGVLASMNKYPSLPSSRWSLP